MLRIYVAVRLGVTLGALALLGWAPAAAQEPPATARGRVYIAPLVGGLWVSYVGEIDGRLLPLEGDLGSPPERIINLAVTVQPSPTAGLTVGYRALESLDVRVSGSFANTQFDLTGVSSGLAEAEGFTTFGGLGNLNVWTVRLDAAWRFLRSDGAFSPYLAGGVGAAIYAMSDPADFFNVEPLTGVRLFPVESRTSVGAAGTIGAGADARVGEQVSLRLEVSDLFGANPVSDSDFEPSTRFVGVTAAKDVVHNLQVVFGVSIRVAGGGP